eukprot:6190571-Pleurochrysis_carterae.AAC.7
MALAHARPACCARAPASTRAERSESSKAVCSSWLSSSTAVQTFAADRKFPVLASAPTPGKYSASLSSSPSSSSPSSRSIMSSFVDALAGAAVELEAREAIARAAGGSGGGGGGP